uniref:Uncharacterized protein n=1 Tax=Rhodosorus marinus TaxID=101924 RepID=A0A7S0BRE4_9RHOD|mmetsp:Transcript_5832/g.8207  ORF Transcript_5832/g.8207 Transcript_5832/m.8207 type:complete len:292 (+) Transcript_5832:505-1380(+)
MHELDTLCGSLLTLQGLPPEELNTVKAQIRLPGNWVGLGLATRVRIHPIAFYAAWLRTLQNNFTCNAFLSRLGTACRGADPSTEHLLEDLASSMDQLEQQLSLASRWTTSRLSSRTSARIRKIALWSTALPTGDAAPASTNPPLAGPLQQILSQESHRRAFEDIVDNSALDDRTRARVRSASGAGAGGWLRDLPSTGSELLPLKKFAAVYACFWASRYLVSALHLNAQSLPSLTRRMGLSVSFTALPRPGIGLCAIIAFVMSSRVTFADGIFLMFRSSLMGFLRVVASAPT